MCIQVPNSTRKEECDLENACLGNSQHLSVVFLTSSFLSTSLFFAQGGLTIGIVPSCLRKISLSK